MKVLYDYQTFEEQKFGGISRYFFELIKHFENENDVEVSLPIGYTKNVYLRSLRPELLMTQGENYDRFFPNLNFWSKMRIYNFLFPGKLPPLNKVVSIDALKHNDYDIFHPTYYDPYHLEMPKKGPFVLTVLDMIHEIFKDYPQLLPEIRENKKLLAEKADRIIAISENTKKDLVNILNINPEKIEVIYLGNSLEPVNTIKLDFELPENYLLFVGLRTDYKNFHFMIENLKEFLKQNRDVKLICTGSAFTEEERSYFENNGIAESVIHHFADDKTLAYLYANAIAFIFPSLYEGFGIPVLEAFSCGCPALISNTSSLVEVGGDAVLYFDPKSDESIKSAVDRIVSDKELGKELKAKGYEQLKKFSWDKTAEQTLALYNRLI
ncbi:MAG: glycosyltransferase family 4 protein [Melioribacteraceae bacterium]|nr:glycosyltransferase family 4 protein [Melioribacteraceae bacterium]MCF8264095.1 glycosyltransferase family 4 protein [Melioribacteraceae bacterium]